MVNIPLFNFAVNDKSLDYLNQIFGSMNGVIYNPHSTGPAGVSITLLGTMFRTFNSVILAVGALLVIYVTVVGVMATAHEGEFMGKKWNNIWIPIRTVIGIAALVPTGSGYSAIQIVMMWVIVQGIGAADTLWNTALGYIEVVGSPYGQVTIPSVGVYNTLTGLFEGLVCEASARNAGTDPANIKNGGYFCNQSKGGFCAAKPAFNPAPSESTLLVGPSGGACGKLSFCNVSSLCSNNPSASSDQGLACDACKAQIASLVAIVPVFYGIAAKFVQGDYEYRQFYYTSYNTAATQWPWIVNYCNAQKPAIPTNQCCVASKLLPKDQQRCKADPGAKNFFDPNEGGYPQSLSSDAVKEIIWPYYMLPFLGDHANFLDTGVVFYTNEITAAVTEYIRGLGQNPDNLSGKLKEASETGWIFAGSYYYAIAQTNNTHLQDSIPTLSVNLPDPNGNAMGSYRNNRSAAQALIEQATGGGSSFGGIAGMSQISGALSQSTASVGQAFQANTNTSTTNNGGGAVDPLSGLQIAGSVMLAVVLILFAVLMLITLGLGLIGNFSIFVVGSGFNNPVGPTWLQIYFLLVPMFMGFMGILITLGGTFSIYLPLVPYVIFTFGAIGWMISTIETMVAGPLVALGILSPSGQHELLGKAEPALMLLFNVFLRPSLMIFGLIAAVLLAAVVVTMINYAFWGAVAQGMGGGGAALANPLAFIIFLCAYVSLIVAALNKCFQAISIIPENVMRWIGGQGEKYGEQEGLGAVEKGTGHGTSGVKSGAQGGEAMSQKGGQLLAKKKSDSEASGKNTEVGGGGAPKGE